jgi:glycosyltransferase 2 family protein
MQKYRKQIIAGLAIALAIYIILLIFMDSNGQFGDGVFDELSNFPLWLIVVLCVTQISAGFFRFLEWHYYLGVIDARDKISIKDSMIIFISGFTMVVSPGKAAELLKSVFLKLKTDVPISKSAPIVIAERVVDGLAVIITLVITLLVAGDRLALGDYRGLSDSIIFSSAALLAFGLIVVQIKPLAYFCLDITAKMPVIKRIHTPLVEFYESSREIFKLKHVIPTTLMGMGVYLSSTTGFVLILWGFGLNITWTLCLQTAFIVGVASAIGALSFIPNGAGITEVSNLAMLKIIVMPSNPEMTLAMAATAALMQGFFHKWFRVVVGMAVAFIYRKRLFTSELEDEIAKVENQRTSQQANLSTEQV